MREIKFRVWDKDDKKMICLGEALKYELLGIDEQDYYLRSEYDSVILMQFTGLLDKNRKEIYEGDLLKLDSWTGLQKVEFIDDAFCLISARGNNEYSSDIHYIHHAGIPQATVIGNIYENPDRLGNEIKENTDAPNGVDGSQGA